MDAFVYVLNNVWLLILEYDEVRWNEVVCEKKILTTQLGKRTSELFALFEHITTLDAVLGRRMKRNQNTVGVKTTNFVVAM